MKGERTGNIFNENLAYIDWFVVAVLAFKPRGHRFESCQEIDVFLLLLLPRFALLQSIDTSMRQVDLVKFKQPMIVALKIVLSSFTGSKGFNRSQFEHSGDMFAWHEIPRMRV